MPLDMPTDTALRFPLLCRAWGETDLPGVRIVNTPAELREFVVAEWLGEEGDELDEVMLQLNDPREWERSDTTDMVSFEFEIGGVSFERVYHSGATAEEAAFDPESDCQKTHRECEAPDLCAECGHCKGA